MHEHLHDSGCDMDWILGHDRIHRAVVLLEGFDNYPSATGASAKGWNQVRATQAGRFGGLCATFTSAGANGQKLLPSTYATLFVGFAFEFTSAIATNAIFNFLTAAIGSVASVSLSAASLLEVRNAAGTVVATGTTVLNINTWYYIEVKCFVNGASGTMELRLNGVSEIASTTSNNGSTNIGMIRFSNGGSSDNTSFDDVYAVDTSGSAPRNTWLGDVRVVTVFPTADGAHSQWTPNSGSAHFSRVNENPPDGDTTYVGDSTPGDLDTYTVTAIDSGATIFGVQTNLYARKDDAATRQIAPVIRQSGSDNVGTTVTMASTYAYYLQLYNQDPTSADWTPTTFNADEFGVKEIA